MQPDNKPFLFPTAESHEKNPVTERPVVIETSEDALDAGVEESFPASDPVSVMVSKVVPEPDEPGKGDR